MKLFNYLFYIILFLGFFLPTNTNFYISLVGLQLSAVEIAFLLLPCVNLLCASKRQISLNDDMLKIKILLFIIIIFFTEIIIKYFFFGQHFGDAFKTIRIGVPTFSCFVLIFQGLRSDVKIVWKVLLSAISCSVILSLLSLVIDLPIYNDLEAGTDILKAVQGRLTNSNASFGIVALYLLFEDKDKWYNRGLLVKVTALLALVSILMSFNRTYIAAIFLGILYFLFRKFSLKQVFRSLIFALFLIGVGFYAYTHNQTIQNQINKRILVIVLGEVSISESAIEGNREIIYNGIKKRINEGYWVIGLPYKKPIFTWLPMYGLGKRDMTVTDTSFINVLMRYGIIPFLIWIIILKSLFWKTDYRIVNVCFLLYALVSLNIDAIFGHNSIFFLIIILFISNYSINNNEKSLPFSQN